MKNQETKERVPVWLEPKAIEKLESLIPLQNVANISQLIAKAVDFYLGYIGTSDATQFLSETLVGVVDSSIRQTEGRNATNLFRLAVEMDIVMQILADGMDIPNEVIENLRGKAIRQVKKSNGKVKFEDALQQNSGEFDEDYV
ncbi:MAG: hypothetical protein RR954_09550, partial [Christensenellaceae bacterium]